MRIKELIKYLNEVFEDYGNLPVIVNGEHALNDVILYDEQGAPETADDYNDMPVELSLED